MQVFCPNCKAQLGLPEGASGKKARCPACQHVFVASDELRRPAEQVQLPPAPVPPLAASGEKPRAYDEPAPRKRRSEDDDAEERPRRRRREDDEDEDDERPRRRRREDDEDDRPRRPRFVDEGDYEEEDSRVSRREAKAKAARAALILYCASGCFMLANVYELVMASVVLPSMPAAPAGVNADAFRFGQMIGAFCGPIFFISLGLIIPLGAHGLSKLRSKGLVITASVICFGFTLLFGFRSIVNMAVLFAPQHALGPISKGWVVGTVILSAFTTVLLLIGGILAIVTLVNHHVQRMYDARRYR
jgi:hypothetical protein